MKYLWIGLPGAMMAGFAHSQACLEQTNSEGVCEAIVAQVMLDCHPVPESRDHLCMSVTESEYGPFHNVAFYRSDAAGDLTMLERVQDTVATFHFEGFTPHGKFLTLVWGEEGHPSFYFYRTQDFVRGDRGEGQRVGALGYIAEYAFHHFDLFSDEGLVVYGIDEDMLGGKPGNCIDVTAIAEVEDKHGCHRILRLPSP